MNPIIQQDIESIVSAPLPWKDFEGATVLVTGGAGFLPAYMVETLLYLNTNVLRKPAQLTVAARNEERARERFNAYKGRKDVVFWKHDLSEYYSGFHANYIVHAASLASPTSYLSSPVETLLPNTIGTASLLDGCNESNGFLFFSSGDAALPLDPLGPRACYGESKRMGETMCAAWHRQFGVPAKIVRISHTYGPGMRLNDGRVFADFTRDILNGGPIVLNSDGSAMRPFLYLADATIAFFTVLLKGEPAVIYNVANPKENISIGALAYRLGQQFNVEVDYRVPRKEAIYHSAPNIDKLQALGWEPKVYIEEGFERTVESYRCQ